MSAYMVADSCINRIVTYVYTVRGIEWNKRQIEAALALQGVIGSTPEEQLANAMFELNCNAVDQRYGDNQAGEFRPLNFKYDKDYEINGFEVYDRLSEWLYQCAEADVPESKLYGALDKLYNHMAHEIVRNARDGKETAAKQDAAARRELLARIQVLEAQMRRKR